MDNALKIYNLELKASTWSWGSEHSEGGFSMNHRLALVKGVYSFRYFLLPMCIPNLLMHVFIMPNPYVICSCIYAFCLRGAMRTWYTHWDLNCNKDVYKHEQTTYGFGKMNTCISRFGIHIGWRKYLNEYMPFGSVSLWNIRQPFVRVT